MTAFFILVWNVEEILFSCHLYITEGNMLIENMWLGFTTAEKYELNNGDNFKCFWNCCNEIIVVNERKLKMNKIQM